MSARSIQYHGNSSSNITIRRTRLTFYAPRKRTKIILFPTYHHVVCSKTKGEEPFCGNFKIKCSYNMRQLNMNDLNFDDSHQFPNTAMKVLFTCVWLCLVKTFENLIHEEFFLSFGGCCRCNITTRPHPQHTPFSTYCTTQRVYKYETKVVTFACVGQWYATANVTPVKAFENLTTTLSVHIWVTAIC